MTEMSAAQIIRYLDRKGAEAARLTAAEKRALGEMRPVCDFCFCHADWCFCR